MTAPLLAALICASLSAAPIPAISIPDGASAGWLIEPAKAPKQGAEVALSAAPDGKVWLLAAHRAFFVPQENALFRADRPVQQVIWLGSGQVARSYGALGRLQYYDSSEGGMPQVTFRPATMVPLKDWRMSPAGDHEVYLAGYNPRVKRWQLARTDLGHVNVLFQSAAKISDVAGGDESVYFASGRAIWKRERAGGASVVFVHPRAAIRRIALNPSGGVFYATDDGVGYAGLYGGYDFIRAARAQIAVSAGKLLVMPGPLSSGILQIDGLDRFAAVAR